MEIKSEPRAPWSLRRKILVGVGIAILLVALGLGLGLGLTLGRSNDNDSDDTSPPNSPPTPLPTPNTTLPWTPSISDTWQIILSHPPLISSSTTSSLTPNVSIFDIDLFDTPVSTIQTLHSLGKKVLCYFSAGSYEAWRPDASQFLVEDLGAELEGWPGERWLNLRSENVRRIMKARVNMAAEKGCDGVDPDNVDGYQNPNGLSLTSSDSISFLYYLSSLTLPLNLSLGLKNAGDIITAVLPIVQFSVNEECVRYKECDAFAPFIAKGKPVFHIEYVEKGGEGEEMERYCKGQGDAEGSEGFSTVLKRVELDGWVEFCDGRVDVTDLDGGLRGMGRRHVREMDGVEEGS